MKIISCENCGCMIDLDRINEDVEEYYDYGCILPKHCRIGDRDIALLPCPACDAKIRIDNGDLP